MKSNHLKKSDFPLHLQGLQKKDNDAGNHKSFQNKESVFPFRTPSVEKTEDETIFFRGLIESLEKIHLSIEQWQETMKSFSSASSSGGGGGMDDEIKKINEKISTIETNAAVTTNEIKNIHDTLKRVETRFDRFDSKIADIPTKSDMSVIVQDVIQKLSLPSKEYVTSEIGKTEISLHKWIVSTGIAVIVLVSGIVFGIVKMLQP